MFLSELAYGDIKTLAIKWIGRGTYSFTADDVANETFLKVAEKELILTEKEVIGLAYGIFRNEFKADKGHGTFKEYITKPIIVTDQKKCNKCGNIISLNAFYLKLDIKTGYQSLSGECKECAIKRNHKYYLANKTKCLLYNKKYQKTNVATTNKASKKYWRNAISELSDVYIKHVLKHCDGVPAEIISDEMIIKKREQILLKRGTNKRVFTTTPKMVRVIKNKKIIGTFLSLEKAACYIGFPGKGKRIGEVLSGKVKTFKGYTFEKLCA